MSSPQAIAQAFAETNWLNFTGDASSGAVFDRERVFRYMLYRVKKCLTCTNPSDKPFCRQAADGKVNEACIDRCHGNHLGILSAEYVAWYNRPEAEGLRRSMEKFLKK
jgi:hypothetical protein